MVRSQKELCSALPAPKEKLQDVGIKTEILIIENAFCLSKCNHGFVSIVYIL